MFTGIIEEIGVVVQAAHDGGGMRLTVEAPSSSAGLKVNDSVSINGVCQTVIKKSRNRFSVLAVEETLRKTTIGELSAGAPVNLELPVRMSDRLGGHLVLGHVDCVGTIQRVQPKQSSWLISVDFPAEFSRYVIAEGSIAIDGISLTVAAFSNNTLVVSIIPHTLEKTTLARAVQGRKVNLEFDVIGKYIERLMAGGNTLMNSSTVTAEKLRAWGYDI